MKTPSDNRGRMDTDPDPDLGKKRSIDLRPKLTHEEVFATGTLIAERYRIVRAIGEGGMAIVYLVRDMKFGMDVVYLAMKVLKFDEEAHTRAAWKKAVTRFNFEARAMSRVSHPHVLPVFDIGECEFYPYFIAKYVDGGYTLEDAIQKTENTGLLFSRCKALVIQILQALAAAHAAGIIHRDVKPDNILIQRIRNGAKTIEHAYLCDLGIAALNQDAQPTGLTIRVPEVKLTVFGEVFGTPAYFAPEQAQGQNADICPATDLYAMGHVFAAMLTGKLPFYACETMTDLMFAHVNTIPPTLEVLSPGGTGKLFPEGCEAVYRRCMAKSPKGRYASAAEMIDAIEALPVLKEVSVVITVPRKMREAVPDGLFGRHSAPETQEEPGGVTTAKSGQTLTPSVLNNDDLGPRRLSRPDTEVILPLKRMPRWVPFAFMGSISFVLLGGLFWYQSQRSATTHVATLPRVSHTPIAVSPLPEPPPEVPVPPVVDPAPTPVVAVPIMPEPPEPPVVEEGHRHGRRLHRVHAPQPHRHVRPANCRTHPLDDDQQIRPECL